MPSKCRRDRQIFSREYLAEPAIHCRSQGLSAAQSRRSHGRSGELLLAPGGRMQQSRDPMAAGDGDLQGRALSVRQSQDVRPRHPQRSAAATRAPQTWRGARIRISPSSRPPGGTADSSPDRRSRSNPQRHLCGLGSGQSCQGAPTPSYREAAPHRGALRRPRRLTSSAASMSIENGIERSRTMSASRLHVARMACCSARICLVLVWAPRITSSAKSIWASPISVRSSSRASWTRGVSVTVWRGRVVGTPRV